MANDEKYPVCNSPRHNLFVSCLREVEADNGRVVHVRMFPRTCVCEQCGHVYPAFPTDQEWRECANRTVEVLDAIDKRKGTA